MMLRQIAICATASLLLAACAPTAPSLPPDRSSVNATHSLSESDFEKQDLALSCAMIKYENDGIRAKANKFNNAINKNSKNNQVAAYIARVLFLPAVLATKQNTAEKENLDALQLRFDDSQRLKRFGDYSS